MSESNNVDGSTETPKIDWEARALKAEAKIIADKKATTTSQTETVTQETPKEEVVTNTNNYMTRDDFEKEKFFEANSELVEHKDKINEYVSKGYSLQDAKTVLLSQDETIKARKVSTQTNFTSWEPSFDQTFTREQLADMSQNDYNKAKDLLDSGKAKLTS